MQSIRGLAVLGAIWTLCYALLMWLITRGHPGPFGLAYIAGMLCVFARLYLLKRWALIGTCGYCWWMVVGSVNNGIGQWTLSWLLVHS